MKKKPKKPIKLHLPHKPDHPKLEDVEVTHVPLDPVGIEHLEEALPPVNCVATPS